MLSSYEAILQHCATATHKDIIGKPFMSSFGKKISAQLPFYCAVCNKKCNCEASYRIHCESFKHLQLCNLPIPEKMRKQREKKMEIPDFYECKTCNLVVSDKAIIDEHYVSEGHRKLKKQRQTVSEYKRVSDLCKAEGMDIGPQPDIGQTVEFNCEPCEMGFSQETALDIHTRGHFHKRYSKAPRQPRLTPRGVGYHCNLCYVHTSCKDVFNKHIEGSDHLKMLKQHPKLKQITDLVIETPATNPATITAETTPASSTPNTSPSEPTSEGQTVKLTSDSQNFNKTPAEPHDTTSLAAETVEFSKTKLDITELGGTDVPSTSTNTDTVTSLSTGEGSTVSKAEVSSSGTSKVTAGLTTNSRLPKAYCEACDIKFHNQDGYNQHVNGKKHIKKTGIPATAPNPDCPRIVAKPEVMFYCNLCDFTAHTGETTLAHLTSETHKTKVEPTSQAPAKFFCKICSVTCREEMDYQAHMKGKRHLRESRAVQLTNAPAGNAQRLGMGKAPALYECKPCAIISETLAHHTKHMNSDKHSRCMELLTKRTPLKITKTITAKRKPLAQGWNGLLSGGKRPCPETRAPPQPTYSVAPRATRLPTLPTYSTAPRATLPPQPSYSTQTRPTLVVPRSTYTARPKTTYLARPTGLLLQAVSSAPPRPTLLPPQVFNKPPQVPLPTNSYTQSAQSTYPVPPSGNNVNWDSYAPPAPSVQLFPSYHPPTEPPAATTYHRYEPPQAPVYHNTSTDKTLDGVPYDPYSNPYDQYYNAINKLY